MGTDFVHILVILELYNVHNKTKWLRQQSFKKVIFLKNISSIYATDYVSLVISSVDRKYAGSAKSFIIQKIKERLES